jgi:hypothetical protein
MEDRRVWIGASLGWVIYEEVGIVIVNDYAVSRVNVV